MAIAYSVCRHLLRKRWQNYGKIQNYWLSTLCQHLLRKRVKIIANFRILFVTPVCICVVAMSKSSKDFRIIFCITRVSGVRIFANNVCQRSRTHSVKMFASMRITSSFSICLVTMTKMASNANLLFITCVSIRVLKCWIAKWIHIQLL